jgi:hypothetical protein
MATFRNITADTRHVAYGTKHWPALRAYKPDETVEVRDDVSHPAIVRKGPDGTKTVVRPEMSFADSFRVQTTIWSEVTAPTKAPAAKSGADKEAATP